MRQWPSVSVIVPLRNSARDMERCLDAILGQNYPGPLDVVLAVGPSDDDTAEVALRRAADPRVAVVDNPSGTTPAALNAAITASAGDIVARVDGHAALPAGYIRGAVETLERTGADNVGGVQDAKGETTFERAVAAAMTSRFGAGDAAFHYGGDAGPTDTVYLGVFRRTALERVGGFDQSLLRNQDYELNWRIRETGGVVWFDPQLRVRYRPRSSLRALARQYYEYGQWKREVLRRHPKSVRARQLIPPVTLIANGLGLLLGVVHRPWWFMVPGGYLATAAVASLRAGRGHGPAVTVRLPAVYSVMHHAWALGFLLSRRRGRTAALR